MLSKKEFDILSLVEAEKKKLSQRQIAKLTGYSVGTVNTTFSELVEKHFIDGDKISEDGLNELEPYRVRRAVFWRRDSARALCRLR